MKKCALLIALLAVSCQMVHRVTDTAAELFGDAVVARVGEHRLMRSELAEYIPAGVSSEDSLGLAQQYIKAWAEELLFLDMAESRLSKEEQDVSKELEEYRRTLLKYRYEERYINERLDTLISDEDVRNYYQAHTDKFLVDRPLLKTRYMIIPADSRSLKKIKELMSSDDAMDAIAADSLDESPEGPVHRTEGRRRQPPGGLGGGYRAEGEPRPAGLLRRTHQRCPFERPETRIGVRFGTRLAQRCAGQRKVCHLLKLVIC